MTYRQKDCSTVFCLSSSVPPLAVTHAFQNDLRSSTTVTNAVTSPSIMAASRANRSNASSRSVSSSPDRTTCRNRAADVIAPGSTPVNRGTGRDRSGASALIVCTTSQHPSRAVESSTAGCYPPRCVPTQPT